MREVMAAKKKAGANPPEPADAVEAAELAKPAQHSPEQQDAAQAAEREEAEQTGLLGDKAARLAVVAERASLCVACDLARTRTHVVFGEGNPEALMMLI